MWSNREAWDAARPQREAAERERQRKLDELARPLLATISKRDQQAIAAARQALRATEEQLRGLQAELAAHVAAPPTEAEQVRTWVTKRSDLERSIPIMEGLLADKQQQYDRLVAEARARLEQAWQQRYAAEQAAADAVRREAERMIEAAQARVGEIDDLRSRMEDWTPD